MKPVKGALLGAALLGACLPAPGCSPVSGQVGERVVFAVASGFGEGDRLVTTADTEDVGVPALYNLTGQSVRVRQVSLVAAPPAVRLLGVTAHPGQPVGILDGNLGKLCRATYPPYPVTDAVTRPHAASNWYLVLAIRFTKPGRYYLGRVKISYTTAGQNGWQYQNLFATIFVKAARPGTKPGFDGCP